MFERQAKGYALKTMRRVALWSGAAIVLAWAIFFALRPPAVLVDTQWVTRGPLRVTINEDGLTRIKDRYIVSTPLAGMLRRIQWEVGDEVTADSSVLATLQALDPSLLDPRAVAQAEARVRAAQRRLEAAQAEAKQAEAAIEHARSEFERASQLHAKRVIATAEFETKEMQFRVQNEQTRAAIFRVGIAEYELDLEKAALLLTEPGSKPASPGESGMELAIKAPISGRVLRIDQESGGALNAGASVMEIGDPADLEIVTDVLSSAAVQIQPGAKVVLENWGGEKPLLGKVRIVEPSGFTKLSALGVEEQRVNVIIDFMGPPETRRNLGDGFRVDSQIVIWEDDDVLKVPTSALFRVGDSWQLFVVQDAVAYQVSVSLGQNNGLEAQVLSGLAQGDEVIVHPSDLVLDNTRIERRYH